MTKKKTKSTATEGSGGETKKEKAKDKGPSVAGMQRTIAGAQRGSATRSAAGAARTVAHSPNQSLSEPPTPEECLVWRDGDVHSRIRAALAVWSRQEPENITSGRTLGQLAVGTGVPWNEGNQARLVQATNAQDVFSPFPSRMKAPPVLLQSSTTVADWERVVWALQTPHTSCFVFGS